MGWRTRQTFCLSLIASRLDIRWAAKPDDADKYAAELVSLTPDVIFATRSMNLAAVQRINHSVPIVFANVTDPVGAGLAVQAEGADIRTVEGLALKGGKLSPLQNAFRANHALQCGFCTPGILMSLDALLRKRLQVTESELREFLSGHLCRCTGYGTIVKAALAAAQELRRGIPDA